MTRAPSKDVLDRLKAAAGAGGFLDDARAIAPHLVEWRERFRGVTSVVLMPTSVSSIQEIVRICAETGTPIVPQGGNTGLVGGQIPSADGSQVVLSLRRFAQIRDVDVAANTMTVDAGAVLADVQAEAQAAERLFPLSLASEGSATIGGLISTNAGGTGVLAYGNMRELVLGIEAVLPDGSLWSGLGGLRKDNTGYDLKQLFIGGEGTLGIVTAATLKLFPRPAAIETAIVAVRDVDAAVRLLNFAQGHAGTVTAFELMPRVGLEFVLRHVPGTRDPLEQAYPWYVLIDVSLKMADTAGAIESLLSDAASNGLIVDGVVAQSWAQRDAFWKLRESLSEAQKPEGGSLKHDVSVPISSIPRFIDEASRAVVAAVPGARPVPFGHLGDGNIHFNISQPVGGDKAAFLARMDEVARVVHDMVHAFEGSISAEHGIGQAKVDEITRYKSPVALEAMRAVKRALDPKGIMNPGKVV
ncbi:MAG: FAD-binding oxidoreductase, partial [Alphaproteobacteria bacterium]|nr:FAD-binding oxidoreductase [Alphaproteobacteria bacterium]